MRKQFIHRVVIIGGGFGGLYTAQALGNAPVEVTLIDKRNFHLFQPLLYQVATGGLSPGDIASPLRSVLRRYPNIQVWIAEAIDIDPDQRRVILGDGSVEYDSLIIAVGTTHHYFGHTEWADLAPGLKTIEDAQEIRRRILLAFETAEREPDPAQRAAWLNFVVVGGGPTGVELAGAIGELAHRTLTNEFRTIKPAESRILLIEGTDRILPTYPADLALKATRSLAYLGVTVQTNTLVTDIQDTTITVQSGEQTRQIEARTVMWAAGIRASSFSQKLHERTGVELDRMGRVHVAPDLSIPNYPDMFVIGDMAHFAHQKGQPLPGVAQVAMQQGQYVAELIKRRQKGYALPAFVYHDRGNLAVIGRNAAIADFGFLRLAGFPAWLIWVFIHIAYLIEFDNRLLVMFQWAWNYFTRKRGARLITGARRHLLIQRESLSWQENEVSDQPLRTQEVGYSPD